MAWGINCPFDTPILPDTARAQEPAAVIVRYVECGLTECDRNYPE
ncbi:hypothetical protein ARUE_c09690 [Arthrobacter sp. Rue61a]|nr:hypothetical protein ARUE_c09690 [Arthrobacter sp. Rue61a]